MIVDDLEERLAQVAQDGRPKVMGIALHAYIVGQPHRPRHLRRALGQVAARRPALLWVTTAGAVYDHVAALRPGTVPGG